MPELGRMVKVYHVWYNVDHLFATRRRFDDVFTGCMIYGLLCVFRSIHAGIFLMHGLVTVVVSLFRWDLIRSFIYVIFRGAAMTSRLSLLWFVRGAVASYFLVYQWNLI